MRSSASFLPILCLAILIGAPAPQAQTADSSESPATTLVLDVSNSMWGQIDGVSKIEIAREVIGDILADWPEGVELGLVAYGHRREGDCTDIETVIPVGAVDPQAYAATVNGLVPRGKTPLTDAVRQAAEGLGYRDVPATVVLVSDGVETCQGDPCALADELERQGVGFTAHVVGFDVSRIEDQSGLSCLAENTGGLYLTADTADELSQAMETVAAPPPPAVRLLALDENGAPVADPALSWTVIRLDDETAVETGRQAARLTLELEKGRYLARAELGHRAGVAEFAFAADGDVTQQVILAPDVSVSPPAEVEAGAEFPVTWTGPDAPGDYLAIAEPQAPVTEFSAYARTRDGSPLTLTAPEQPGAYEVRYVAAARGEVLAAAPVTVAGPEVTLDAPETATPRAPVSVAWTGPGRPGDFITIVPADAPDAGAGITARTDRGSPLSVEAPPESGDYEIRYVSHRGQVLARAPLAVFIPATIEAPPVANAGSDIEIGWTGPDNRADYITIVPEGTPEEEHGNRQWTERGSPLSVRAPDAAGPHEIRYVSGVNGEILATLPLTLTEITATLEAAPVANAGSDVEVTWEGPDNRADYITIVPEGTPEGERGNRQWAERGSPLTVRAPDASGPHEIRYVSGQSGQTLASLPLTLTENTATLEAAPVANAGADVEVTWTGPDNRGDFLTIVPVGTPEGERRGRVFTNRGSPLTVRAPDAAGPHEIRYVSGQSKETLAALPLTLTENTATLEAPPVAAAGADVEVTWTGPDNRGDFLTIVPSGTPEGERGQRMFTDRGSPSRLKTPEESGSYEVRYVSGQSGRTLATLPIRIQ